MIAFGDRSGNWGAKDLTMANCRPVRLVPVP
jgi:hypothetical protein